MLLQSRSFWTMTDTLLEELGRKSRGELLTIIATLTKCRKQNIVTIDKLKKEKLRAMRDIHVGNPDRLLFQAEKEKLQRNFPLYFSTKKFSPKSQNEDMLVWAYGILEMTDVNDCLSVKTGIVSLMTALSSTHRNNAVRNCKRVYIRKTITACAETLFWLVSH